MIKKKNKKLIDQILKKELRQCYITTDGSAFVSEEDAVIHQIDIFNEGGEWVFN